MVLLTVNFDNSVRSSPKQSRNAGSESLEKRLQQERRVPHTHILPCQHCVGQNGILFKMHRRTQGSLLAHNRPFEMLLCMRVRVFYNTQCVTMALQPAVPTQRREGFQRSWFWTAKKECVYGKTVCLCWIQAWTQTGCVHSCARFEHCTLRSLPL